ncbi:hypothetical protein MTR_4g019650 [Medicago truncatula]|uniref:Uncharacterized protein n=1 Tax=Medicago truncatula TaxID=3880 RepID=A0A072UIR1_MEDTR|nr:hypothetical protein MTR_4g019650 [Medicago truncatula]
MSEVAKIKDRVRYSAFKKTIKVMITPTDSLDDLKAHINAYFEHLGETQYTRPLFAQMPCIDHLGVDKHKDEDMFKTTCYVSWLIHDDSDIGFMFSNMVEDNILYIIAFGNALVELQLTANGTGDSLLSKNRRHLTAEE